MIGGKAAPPFVRRELKRRSRLAPAGGHARVCFRRKLPRVVPRPSVRSNNPGTRKPALDTASHFCYDMIKLSGLVKLDEPSRGRDAMDRDPIQMLEPVAATYAKVNFGTILHKVSVEDERYVVNRQGNPVAVILGYRQYADLVNAAKAKS